MTVEGLIDSLVIDKKFAEREQRLPHGIRKYIRRLKEEGQLQEAMIVRERAVEVKRNAREKLMDKLNKDVRNAILSDTAEERAFGEFEATWILAQTNEIDENQRRSDLGQVYENYPDLDKVLESKAAGIVTEVGKLVKEASNY